MVSLHFLPTRETASLGDLWGLAHPLLSRSRVISECRLTSQPANHRGHQTEMVCVFLNSFDLCSGLHLQINRQSSRLTDKHVLNYSGDNKIIILRQKEEFNSNSLFCIITQSSILLVQPGYSLSIALPILALSKTPSSEQTTSIFS